MNFKQIASFVKIEHTLFSLPFVLIGYLIAYDQFQSELTDTGYGCYDTQSYHRSGY
jgi:hypothetical protein